MMEPFLSCLSLFLQHLTQDVAHGRHWVSEWERRLNVGKEYCEVIVSGSSQQTGVRVRSSPYFLSLCVDIKNCVQVVGNRTVLRGVEAMYYWEAFEDCTIWSEAILHWHFWAEAQTFLKDSEPSVLILNLSSFFFFFSVIPEPQSSVTELPFQVTVDNGLKTFFHHCENWPVALSFPQMATADFLISTFLTDGFSFFFFISSASETSKNVSSILWLSLTLPIKFLRVPLLYLNCS